MNPSANYDVVIYGATGFTGRLVAEYMNTTYGVGKDVSWAMAGRSLDKLKTVRDEMGIPKSVELIVADASDPASLDAMVKSARCVLTTVGPYQLYGTPLVEACATNGTDYVDLSGEVAWMHDMIAAYEDTAKKSGARIVFSCGFDSIPFDLGVLFLQNEAMREFGTPAVRVKGRMRKMKGTFSGGTAASGRESMARAMRDPAVMAVLRNPFSLTGGFEGPDQPHGMSVQEDDDFGSWVAPFIMAPINTKNIHRSNAVMGHPYGNDFVYDEMMLTGPGEAGKAAAEMVAKSNTMGGDDGPKPGEGPSKEEREAGLYDFALLGITKNGDRLRATVTGDKDPGYGSTSKIISEAAICLVKDCTDLGGGIYTPAAAMGLTLVGRLESHAGLTFNIDK
ncbi:saccharopine dehydrogenase family protein [Hyphomonas sp.]|jgi:short subunit dehydrogenase-like uncharacterized protein|uniref:saccharopine dehydrogenase family protein n=1 Tax=Hyphomonas sp. TaxID=87 RepID=UPI00356299E7